MMANEVTTTREVWISKCTGISPVMGNNLDAMAEKGTLIKETVAIFDNGIRVVCYRDKQNRFAGSGYETSNNGDE